MSGDQTAPSTDGMVWVEVYNRPAVVEQRLPTVSKVRWQDNGTQGFVPTEELEAGR